MSAFFQTGTPAQSYFSVTTDITRFDGLVFQSFFTPTIDYCALSSDMRTFPSSITLESIAANIAPTGSYTQLTFSYAGLTATSGPSVDIARPTVTQTPEEKSRSLAAFIARVPAPVVPATTTTTAK